jgi:hypothetical protein
VQAAPLNTPSTFSKWAKVNREIGKREKDLEQLKTKAAPTQLDKTLKKMPMMVKVRGDLGSTRLWQDGL